MTSWPLALAHRQGSHWYARRRQPLRVIVMHVTAGLEDLDMEGVDHSAEATVRYGASTTRRVSWHAIADSDSAIECLPAEAVAFHVRGYNSASWGLELCNRTATWADKPEDWTAATLAHGARLAHRVESAYRIPRQLITREQVDAGWHGYISHAALDPARRTDPGPDFPWRQWWAALGDRDAGKTFTKGVVDMRVVKISGTGEHYFLTCHGASPRPMTTEELGAWRAVESGTANRRQLDVVDHLAMITRAA